MGRLEHVGREQVCLEGWREDRGGELAAGAGGHGVASTRPDEPGGRRRALRPAAWRRATAVRRTVLERNPGHLGGTPDRGSDDDGALACCGRRQRRAPRNGDGRAAARHCIARRPHGRRVSRRPLAAAESERGRAARCGAAAGAADFVPFFRALARQGRDDVLGELVRSC